MPTRFYKNRRRNNHLMTIPENDTIWWKKISKHMWINYAGRSRTKVDNRRSNRHTWAWYKTQAHLMQLGTLALTPFAIYFLNKYGAPTDRFPREDYRPEELDRLFRDLYID